MIEAAKDSGIWLAFAAPFAAFGWWSAALVIIAIGVLPIVVGYALDVPQQGDLT